MRIILEGPDNAGKTTLANRIIDQVGDFTLYHHPGGKPVGMAAEEQCVLDQKEWLGHTRVIVDRVTPISQRVYNPHPEHDVTRVARWWEMCDRFRPIVIYCRPSTDKLLRVQDLTWREGETEEHKQKIITNQHVFVERYDAIFAKIPHVHYDFEQEGAAALIVAAAVSGMSGNPEADKWFRQLMNSWRTR